jgi:peptidoglycan/LPS O-acetylase OafA/YrhL
VLLAALIGGEPILDYFGIGLPAFRVAGGILVLLMGISMLHLVWHELQAYAGTAMGIQLISACSFICSSDKSATRSTVSGTTPKPRRAKATRCTGRLITSIKRIPTPELA